MKNIIWIVLSIAQAIILFGLLFSLPSMYRREARRKEAEL